MPVILLSLSQFSLKLRLTPRRRDDAFYGWPPVWRIAWGNPAIQRGVALSDRLIDELKTSDLLAIGAPMYNLNVPTDLKKWFDLVARARETFRYTDSWPQGLVEGVRAVVISSRGGVHCGQDTDPVTPYLRSVLGLMGISEVTFIYAEGLDIQPHGREAGIAQATEQLIRLTQAS